MNIRNIFYLCPEVTSPIGGVKKIYNHVDVLNRHGFSAYVLHSEPHYRSVWFENQTPIAYPKIFTSEYLRSFFVKNDISRMLYHKIIGKKRQFPRKGIWTTGDGDQQVRLQDLSDEDVIVIPEYCVQSFVDDTFDLPFVIFNQCSYDTFNERVLPQKMYSASHSTRSPYQHEKLRGVMTVSHDSAEYLRYAYGDQKITTIPNSIDFDLFPYSADKKKQIAYMPRKCFQDSKQVVNLLIDRGHLSDWTFCPIHNLSEQEVSQVLQESALFLSFSHQEGFGLPPLEAMACGSIVIGYHGEGGKEFIKSPYALPISHGEIIPFAKKVEETALSFEKDQGKWIEFSKNASEFVRQQYAQEREENQLIQFWKDINSNQK